MPNFKVSLEFLWSSVLTFKIIISHAPNEPLIQRSLKLICFTMRKSRPVTLFCEEFKPCLWPYHFVDVVLPRTQEAELVSVIRELSFGRDNKGEQSRGDTCHTFVTVWSTAGSDISPCIRQTEDKPRDRFSQTTFSNRFPYFGTPGSVLI